MINPALFSSNTEEWYTPQDFFEQCAKEIGGFDLDPCATAENAKCPKFYTKEDNGLAKEWSGNVWVNPPYGRAISEWVEKCATEREREGDHDLPTHPVTHRYTVLSRLPIRETRRRTSIYSRTSQVLRGYKLRTVSVSFGNF